MGGAGRGDAGVRRFVPLSAGNLRAAENGAADFVSFHLATLLQRSAFHRNRLHWTGRICGVLLAGLANCLFRAYGGPPHSLGGATTSKLAGDAGNRGGDRRMLPGNASAIPADYSD